MEPAVEPDDLAARRAATLRLGAQVRELNHAMVASEAPAEMLDEATETLRKVTDALAVTSRARGEVASVDDVAAGIRLFNASSGAANPTAPPVVAEHANGRVVGRATLGLPHEGHVTLAHGGVLAVLLDDVLGRTVVEHASAPAVTSKLTLRYRRPVPLHTPLEIRGELVELDGRRVFVRGAVYAESEPDVVLAEADGLFVQLREEQLTALFGSVTGAGTGVPRDA